MKSIWAQIQANLEKILPAGHYKVWIAPLMPAGSLDACGDELVILAPGEYAAQFVRTRFLDALRNAAEAVLGRAVSVQVRAGRVASAPSVAPADTPAPAPIETRIPSPRPLTSAQLALPLGIVNESPAVAPRVWRHTFEDFVVGPSNEMAYAASKGIGRDAGFDVLFLCSGPGLGKTHLMQAAGKALCDSCNRTRPRVEYAGAEAFATNFVMALKHKDIDRFKARYRNLDLLLLEDVHFLQGKEKTQAELLATLDALRDCGGKVVFTGSFLPKDMRDMDERLVSRMTAGIVSAIQRPDADTRRRIVRQKAALHQVILPEEAEEVLTRHLCADVRQIESCLQNLILKARLCNCIITSEMALEAVGSFALENPMLDLEAIIAHVCRGFSLSREQLFSIARKQEYVAARNTAFYLARKHTELSLEAIGKRFNRRHSTVLKGITNLEREISRQTPLGRQAAGTVALIERNSLM